MDFPHRSAVRHSIDPATGYQRLALSIIMRAIMDILRLPSRARRRRDRDDSFSRDFLYAVSAAMFLRSPFMEHFPELRAPCARLADTIFDSFPEGTAAGDWIRSPDCRFAIHAALRDDSPDPGRLVPRRVLLDCRRRAGILAALIHRVVSPDIARKLISLEKE